MTPFRLAIIGCGKISTSHAEAILASPLAELVALVDPTRERAVALAERFGVTPVIATDVAEVLELVDGVVVATPNHTHADVAEQCLGKGVSVLIEKPLAIDVAQGTRILEAGARAGKTVAVGYVSRFRENVLLMSDLIHQGYFGRVRRFAYQFGTRGGWAPLSGYNLDRKTSGGGVLVTTGTHFLDRMLDWFGFPDECHLIDDGYVGPEANAEAHFTYRSGLVGVARFSKTVAMQAGFVMETDRGTVILKDRPDVPILVRDPRTPDIEQTIGRRQRRAGGDEFVKQLEDFIAASREGRSPMVDASRGLDSIRLLQNLYGNRRGKEASQPQAAGASR